MTQAIVRWILIALITVIGFGCARPVHLPIIYQLPPAGTTVQIAPVGFEVIDTRTRPNVLGPAAKKELPDFSDRFTLFQNHTVGKPVSVGIVSPQGLFEKVFRDALIRQRIPIAPPGTSPERVFRIDIQRFELERVALKWLATIDYTASVRVNGQQRKSQTIQGTAERVLFVARKDATKVLSELVTDIAARLDTTMILVP